MQFPNKDEFWPSPSRLRRVQSDTYFLYMVSPYAYSKRFIGSLVQSSTFQARRRSNSRPKMFEEQWTFDVSSDFS